MVVYLIQGATSNCGFAVTVALLKRIQKGKDVVRAGVRDQKSPKIEVLKKLGAEIVEVDTKKPKNIKKAFKTVERLFIVPPFSEDKADITRDIVKEAIEAGVKFIVDISGLGAEYEAITLSKQLRASEKHVEASKIDWTHLRPSYFQENFLGQADNVKKGNITLPMNEGKFAPITVEDIGECAAVILTSGAGSHKGKAYNLTGPKLLNGTQIARTFPKYVTQVVSFFSPSIEQYSQDLKSKNVPAWIVKILGELYGLFAANQAAVLTSDVQKLLGRKPKSFKQFVQANRTFFQPEGTPIILVQGATGNTGGSTVRELLKKRDYVIRAGVRDLYSKEVEELKSLGAQVVLCDSNKSKTVEQAMEKVTKLLVVPPNDEHRADITKSIVKFAKKAGVKHIVDISVYGAEHESILFGKQLRASERHVEASGVEWTHLRPIFFQDNLLGQSEGIKNGGLYLPLKEGKIPVISVKDIGKCAAHVLTTSGHGNKHYSLTGPEALSGVQMAQLFSKELVREVKYVSPSNDDFKKSLEGKGVKPWQIKGYIELFDLFATNQATVTSDVQKLLGKKPHSLAYFIRRNVSTFDNRTVIVVQGATGNTGGATIRALLERKDKCIVRAGVRDLNSDKTNELRQLGARVVVMDTSKPASLRKTLAGAHKLVIVPPNEQNRADTSGILAKAARKAGIKHIVDISVLGAEYEGILFGKQLRASEKNVEKSGVKWTHIRPIFFQQNFFGWAEGIKNGGLYIQLKEGKVPVINTKDIGECIAVVLLTEGHEGKSYNLTGPEALSGDEMAKLFTEVLGHEVKYFSPTTEQTLESLEKLGVQEWQRKGYIELFELFSSHQCETVFDDVKKLTGKEPTSFRDFITGAKPAFARPQSTN